jgi:hypothetical protein
MSKQSAVSDQPSALERLVQYELHGDPVDLSEEGYFLTRKEGQQAAAELVALQEAAWRVVRATNMVEAVNATADLKRVLTREAVKS